MSTPLIDRRHSLGHPDIDADHAVIGDLWLRAVNCSRREFPLHLARLKKAMQGHFERERMLLAEVGRPLCIKHQAEHESLLRLCAEASHLYQSSWRRTQSHLRNRFAKMMREHIVSMDLCTVLTIRTSDSAEPRDRLTAE
jgi:hemerythrin-like metal-binding protein